MQKENNLMMYVAKKNYLTIYGEFLTFQTIGSFQPIHLEHKAINSDESAHDKRLNIRNFNALYWIVLYLKEIKDHSLPLIYDFFLYKNWTTWQFKNFSYHYYKIIQSDKVKNEIRQLENFINQEENYWHATQPHNQNSPENLPKEKSNKPHKPVIVGDYLNNHKTAIHLNSSLEDSQTRLKQTIEKMQNN